ncbi:MAG: hypothetical protein CMK09_01630 [Ponticaulis sp.]|nr:hypothetical protein [Ponticaulis sp.]|tara:strand:+ start:5562 stop:6113 length:552 start_codon:yes stop_codon:yes gene_type:complete
MDAREERIVNAAKTLLSRFGEKKMTMDTVANSVGLSRSALYHYFASKKNLVLATHKYLHTRNRNRIEQALKESDNKRPGVLKAVLLRENFLFELAESSDDKTWYEESNYPAVRDLLSETETAYAAQLQTRLELLGIKSSEAQVTTRLLTMFGRGARESASSKEELVASLKTGVGRLFKNPLAN